jgi:hypothetical protein
LLGWINDSDEGNATAVKVREECADVIVFGQERALMLALRSSNGALLATLDDQSPTDDEDESELGIYVSECLNVAGLSAELLPEATLPTLCNGIAQAAGQQIAAGAPSQWTTADVATLLALAGRLAELVIGDNLMPRVEIARGLFERVLAAAAWANSYKMHSFGESLALSHARIVGSIPAWYRWLNEVLRSGDQGEASATEYCTKIVAICFDLLDGSAAAPVALSAAQTFKLLCEAVHARALSSLPQVTAAFGAHATFELLAPPARERVYGGLVCILALPSARIPHNQ